MASPTKYSRELLEQAVLRTTTWMGLMRELGTSDKSGGMIKHVRARLSKYGISTEHFLGLRHNLGAPPKNRKSAETILVAGYTKRAPGHQLLRALLDTGRPYQCAECSLGPEWNGKPLYLPVDHVNGDWSDNRPSNLRFLCPNCHWQTPTFGNRARTSPSKHIRRCARPVTEKTQFESG